jgi:hypothetical protein
MATITGTLATVEAADVAAIDGTAGASGVRERQTFAFDVRDAMFNVVTADPYFAAYTKRKNKWLPVQTNLVPYIGVYLINEVMTPDGDANAGLIRFSHTMQIGFSVVQSNNDPLLLEQNIDQAQQKIMTLLWTDLHLMNVLQNDTAGHNNPEDVKIESVTRATRRHVFGQAAGNNEFPFVELEFNVNAFARSEWYPDITDTLNEIDVTVAPNNDDPNANPLTIKYMFDTLRKALVKEEKTNGPGFYKSPNAADANTARARKNGAAS